MTYTDYIRELLLQKPIGMPIYTKIIATSLSEQLPHLPSLHLLTAQNVNPLLHTLYQSFQ